MARSMGNTLADLLAMSIGYSERLLKDVLAASFGRFAAPGGTPIESNHPAFSYGHLALYAPRIVEQLGGTPPALPAVFQEKFAKGAVCLDDVAGDIYPSMAEITEHYFSGYAAALSALRAADEAMLDQPNPSGPPMIHRLPTIGAAHGFYASGHMMVHLGQVSAWRRMMGLGSV